VADEYVWVYGEKFRWWPTPNGGVRPESWPEALPDCDKALRYARDPLDYARTEIAAMRAAGSLVNLARNGEFGAETARSWEGVEVKWHEGAAPAGWHTWQEAASKGIFAWDRATGAGGPGSARASGVGGGCFLQSYPAALGERYAVRAQCKLQGKGDGSIRVRWQTADGDWTAEILDKMIYGGSSPGEWHERFGVAEVPEGAGRLVLLLGVRGQDSPGDVLWYDDVELYRLP